MIKKYSPFFALLLIFISGVSFSQTWQTYPYSPPNSVLNFPQDDGYHPAANTSTEWWYINMTLIGSAPAYKKYSGMLCYFRFANMRLFNIASESDDTYVNDVLQAFPVLTAQLNHWELTYTKLPPNPVNDFSKWTNPTDGKTYSYLYHAEDPVHNDALDVTVTSNRPPLVVGGNGYIALGDQGDSSFYYSYSNMKVTGTIKYKGVTDNITSGIAWIDRQYGPFTVGVNSSNLYEWFSLQLDNPGVVLGVPQSPYEFNIWQIFSDSSSVPYKPEWRLVSGIYPDETQDTSCSFIFERTGYWYDQSESKYYSQGWRFINPARDITVDMVAPVKDQLVDVVLFRFWEGGTNLKGVIQDKNVDGVGFAEIVAGHPFQITVPSAPGGVSASSYPDHYSLSWQASVAGTYPIGGYRVYRSRTNDGHWKYIGTTSNLSYDDYSAPMDSAFYYTVTAFDNQTATSASGYADAVLGMPVGNEEFQVADIRLQVFPNPFSEKTTIRMRLPREEYLEIGVFDLPGRKLATLVNETVSAGEHSFSFESEDLPAGTFLLRIQAGKIIKMKKMVVW